MPTNRALHWTLIAFIVAGLLMAGLVVWQLAETTPARWCVLAKQGSPELNAGCLSVLLKLLEIKDHSVMALLCILGLTVVSVVVVALGVRINADGPGGFSVDVGADKTRITAGDAEATIPTPPASE